MREKEFSFKGASITTTLPQNWRLDHVGHAVKDLDEGIRFYESTLGLSLSSREEIPSFQVEAAFLLAPGSAADSEGSAIELLSPLSPSSVLTKFIEKNGAGLHHICFEVTSVVDELRRLKQLGTRLIDEAPRAGAHGKDVAFLHPHAGLGTLIEICSPRRT